MTVRPPSLRRYLQEKHRHFKKHYDDTRTLVHLANLIAYAYSVDCDYVSVLVKAYRRHLARKMDESLSALCDSMAWEVPQCKAARAKELLLEELACATGVAALPDVYQKVVQEHMGAALLPAWCCGPSLSRSW